MILLNYCYERPSLKSVLNHRFLYKVGHLGWGGGRYKMVGSPHLIFTYSNVLADFAVF